mmetsp:Transcript_5288/g.13510  ORF Transcript_5288/g.13510 Transcript_5288/m.13510 type:complete len:281 (+) Transcript_5288:2090-2932(+)
MLIVEIPRAPNDALDAVTLVPTSNAPKTVPEVAANDPPKEALSARTVPPTSRLLITAVGTKIEVAKDALDALTCAPTARVEYTVLAAAVTDDASSAPYMVPRPAMTELTSRVPIPRLATPSTAKEALAAVTLVPICKVSYIVPEVAVIDVEKVPMTADTLSTSIAPYTVAEDDVVEPTNKALAALIVAPISSSPYTVPDVAVNVFVASSPYTLAAAEETVVTSKLLMLRLETSRELNDAEDAVTIVPTSNAPYTLPVLAVTESVNTALKAVNVLPVCKGP